MCSDPFLFLAGNDVPKGYSCQTIIIIIIIYYYIKKNKKRVAPEISGLHFSTWIYTRHVPDHV